MLSEFIQLIETVIHWLPPPGELERFTDLRHSAERLVVRAEQAQDSERDRLLSEADSLYSEAACCRVGKKDLANLWVDRAKLSRAGGLDWVAENDLQRALRFWPRCPEAHLELARLYAARNDTDRAVCLGML